MTSPKPILPPPLPPLPEPGTRMRHVVLRPTLRWNPHFDLMLQPAPDAMLLTWCITEYPETWPPENAQRLPDHRPAYMTYEGPVSNNRGEVKRIARGEALVLNKDTATIDFKLTGDIACNIKLPTA